MLEQVVLVGGEEDEFFVGESSHSISVGVHFILDVETKMGAREHGVGSEQDVERIVYSCTSRNYLGVVSVKLGVKELNDAFDRG